MGMLSVITGKRALLAWALGLAGPAAHGLQAMSEADMSSVSGRDGLSAVLSSQTINLQTMRLDVDSAESVLAGSNAYMDLDNVQVTGVGADGAGTGSAFSITTGLDAGVNGTDQPYLALDADWTRTRFQVGAVHHENQTGNSIGSFAFDSSGSITLVNQGILNDAVTDAMLDVVINDGIWWYRQSGNEFVWDNMQIDVNGGISLSRGASYVGIGFAHRWP